MTRYLWDGDRFVNRTTGEPMEAPERVALPSVIKDVHYKSPLSGKEVTSRSQRREEMKVHEVREVDPSEFTPVYRSKKYAERMRGEHQAIERPKDAAPFERLSRDDLPARFRT